MLNEAYLVPGMVGIPVFTAAFLVAHATGFINPFMAALFMGFIAFEMVFFARKRIGRKPKLRVVSAPKQKPQNVSKGS